MKTLRNEKDRKAIIGRINSLSGEEKAAWGRMTLEQMVSHLVQAGEMPFVESVPARSTFASRTFIKPLVLYVLPMPKEVKVSAELDQQQAGRKPQGLAADRETLIELTNKLGTLPEGHQCLDHPMFGKMSAKEWALIAHKHMDHHLRQFGV